MHSQGNRFTVFLSEILQFKKINPTLSYGIFSSLHFAFIYSLLTWMLIEETTFSVFEAHDCTIHGEIKKKKRSTDNKVM